MDFARLNKVAGNQRTIKRIKDFEVNKCYVIESMKQVETKYGNKVVVDLEDDVFAYLPARVCKELLANGGAGLKNFQAQLEETSYSIRRLEGSYNPIEFLLSPTDNSESE